MEEMAHMASGTRDEFTDAVENVTSRQDKLAEAQGAQTENQQRAEQAKQDSPVSREKSAKPARTNGNKKATKRTKQAPQTPGPTDKSKVKVSGPSDKVIA